MFGKLYSFIILLHACQTRQVHAFRSRKVCVVFVTCTGSLIHSEQTWSTAIVLFSHSTRNALSIEFAQCMVVLFQVAFLHHNPIWVTSCLAWTISFSLIGINNANKHRHAWMLFSFRIGDFEKYAIYAFKDALQYIKCPFVHNYSRDGELVLARCDHGVLVNSTNESACLGILSLQCGMHRNTIKKHIARYLHIL